MAHDSRDTEENLSENFSMAQKELQAIRRSVMTSFGAALATGSHFGFGTEGNVAVLRTGVPAVPQAWQKGLVGCAAGYAGALVFLVSHLVFDSLINKRISDELSQRLESKGQSFLTEQEKAKLLAEAKILPPNFYSAVVVPVGGTLFAALNSSALFLSPVLERFGSWVFPTVQTGFNILVAFLFTGVGNLLGGRIPLTFIPLVSISNSLPALTLLMPDWVNWFSPALIAFLAAAVTKRVLAGGFNCSQAPEGYAQVSEDDHEEQGVTVNSDTAIPAAPASFSTSGEVSRVDEAATLITTSRENDEVAERVQSGCFSRFFRCFFGGARPSSASASTERVTQPLRP